MRFVPAALLDPCARFGGSDVRQIVGALQAFFQPVGFGGGCRRYSDDRCDRRRCFLVLRCRKRYLRQNRHHNKENEQSNKLGAGEAASDSGAAEVQTPGIFWETLRKCSTARRAKRLTKKRNRRPRSFDYVAQRSSIFNAAINADCGISTSPNWRIRFLPSFCLSRSLRLRLMSPP
jgi:hypothetical protein